MAAKDNTLGAPTEGLGQTVTFTAQGGAGVPQLTIPDRGAARLGQGGGQVGTSGQARQVQAAAPDPTMAALMKLGGKLLEPAIKREQEAMFMQGVQRASEGEAIKEIVDEQPWYSKLFGSTNLVDGARAQTAAAKSTGVIATMEADIDNLKKLDGKAMAAHAQKVMREAANTGDPTTDALIQQSLLQNLPTFMKGQSKAHLKHQQDVFLTTRGDLVSALADKLQIKDTQEREGKTVEGADVLTTKAEFAQEGLVRPEGVDEDTFNKEIVSRLTGKIVQGNFAVYEALRDTEFLKGLPGNMQVAIEEAHQRARIGARAKLPMEFIKREAEWRALSNDPTASQDKIIAMGADIANEYAKHTGDKSERYFSNAQYLQEFAQLDATKAQAAAAEARAKEKALRGGGGGATSGVTGTNPILQAIEDVQGGLYMTDFTPKERKTVWKELNATSSPHDLIRIRAKQAQAGIYDTEFKDSLNIDVRGAIQLNDPVKLEEAYQKYWVPTVKQNGDLGEAVALAYADDDVEKVMVRYHKMAKGEPADGGMVAARYAHAALPPSVKLDSSKGSLDVVDEGVLKRGMTGRALLSLGRGVLGNDTYPLENTRQVLGWIKGNRNDDIEDADQRVGHAIRKTQGLTIIGGFGVMRSAKAASIDEYWDNSKPGNKYAEKFAPGEGNRNRVFRSMVDAVVSEMKIKSALQVMQAPDLKGVPLFLVSGLDAQDNTVHKLFTADEAAKYYRDRKTGAKLNKSGNSGILNDDTFLPKDNRAKP